MKEKRYENFAKETEICPLRLTPFPAEGDAGNGRREAG